MDALYKLLRIVKDNEALASSEYEEYKQDITSFKKAYILLHPEVQLSINQAVKRTAFNIYRTLNSLLNLCLRDLDVKRSLFENLALRLKNIVVHEDYSTWTEIYVEIGDTMQDLKTISDKISKIDTQIIEVRELFRDL